MPSLRTSQSIIYEDNALASKASAVVRDLFLVGADGRRAEDGSHADFVRAQTLAFARFGVHVPFARLEF